MHIKLTCSCGASFEASSGTFINGGGTADEKGRVYLVEVRADEWLDRHARCRDLCRSSASGAIRSVEIQSLPVTISTLEPLK